MKPPLRKISITGPESTGKSWLARELAAHYQTVFVPEFAREYLNKLNRDYDEDDLLTIAQNQLLLEDQALLQARNYLFCDSDMLVMRIWSLHKYGKCHPWIEERYQENRYDLYVLCDIDLPWEYDTQREHPHLRQYLFDWYRSELTQAGFPFEIISGEGVERVYSALNIMQRYFTNV